MSSFCGHTTCQKENLFEYNNKNEVKKKGTTQLMQKDTEPQKKIVVIKIDGEGEKEGKKEQRKERNAEVNLKTQSVFERAEKQQGCTQDWIFVTMQREKGARGICLYAC